MADLPAIAPRLLRWAARHGRHDLPWQNNADPYRIWVSEIMLQQTQVNTVIPYFQRFMRRFPTVTRLADAPLDDVLAHWSGLGYYARARNLHRAAQRIRDDFSGRFPQDIETLTALPGIGRSTAGAILALAFSQRHAILDGNVKRVLARYHAVTGWPGDAAVARQLWELADGHTPRRRVAAYTQAIMDLGATVCTRGRPRCDACPLAGDCQALAMGRIADYPVPRPRRSRPARQAVFALIEDSRGSVLLVRRPPAGIWGGLWCLPEWPDQRSCLAWLRQYFGAALMNIDELPPLQHGFTHFSLTIEPLHVTVTSRGGQQLDDAATTSWHSREDSLALGLPAPVRQLLQSNSNRQEMNDDAHGPLRKTG